MTINVGDTARVNARGAYELNLPIGLEIQILRRMPGARGRHTDGKRVRVIRGEDLWAVAYKSTIHGYDSNVMTDDQFDVIECTA